MEASVADGEVQLEKALGEVDVLEADVHAFDRAPGAPIDVCVRSDGNVIERDLAWRLAMSKTSAAQGKTAEQMYYALLRDGAPATLLPVVHLRKHYYEGLKRCVLGLLGRPEEATTVSILSTSSFDAEISHGIVVVDFMTHWCVPCKKMARDLEKLACDHRDRWRIGRLDVDRNMAVAERFGVTMFPTLVLFRDGREVARISHGLACAEIAEWAERALQEPGEE
jgi:thiol-disulfide isomerase/thioredoxin